MEKILVDHREDKAILKEFVKASIDYEVQQLATADFIVRTKNLDGKIQTVGIERKTQNDFLNSIIDKRIFNQLITMKEHFDVSLLIVEGTLNIYSLRDFHPNAIRGVLTTIAVDFQIPILYTQNVRDTAHIIGILVKRLVKERSPIVFNAKPKMMTVQAQQECIVGAFQGIGPVIAKNVLETFGSVRGVMNASEKELQKVEKIGKAKAKGMRKIIEASYERHTSAHAENDKLLQEREVHQDTV